jgi:hypothetical protein
MQEIDQIKEKFCQVITYSQGIPDPKVDKLFDLWYEGKKDIIKALNGELIYTYPKKVSFELGKKDKNDRVNDFISVLESRYGNYDLSDFVNSMKDCFFNNLTSYDYTSPDGNIIKKGSKLVKAFKYFENNKEALTDIQNYASRVIQEDKIEGYLCLSVHPLDFLSVSENTHNWRSCHALDGDYRSGNLSYMTDSSTIVCYLRSEHNEILPNFPFPWNTKKWRVLLYLSDDWNMMFAGRQYPFSSDNGINFVLKELILESGLTKGYKWEEWHDETVDFLKCEHGDTSYFKFNQPFYPVGRRLVGINDLIKDKAGSMQFNDLLRSSCYKPIYAFKQEPNYWFRDEFGLSDYNTTHFNIGGAVPCLCCEKKPLEIENTMRCIECEEKYGHNDDDLFGYCSCCGRHVYIDNALWIEDELVCDQCAETELVRCDCCGDTVFKDEIVYNREKEQYLCRQCQEDLMEF